MARKFVIKEATRQRCKIVQMNSERIRRLYKPISLELFHFIGEADSIDFSVFIRVGDEMVEYIRPTELSQELLQHIWKASLKPGSGIDVCVLRDEYPRFEHVIETVRRRKLDALMEKEPGLDPKVLHVFGDLSGASQMILRGGINQEVASRVSSAASFMVSNLMDNEFAMGTLSRMINIDPTLYDHSAAVAMFAGIMARQYMGNKLSRRDGQIIAQCGLYHDAGKSCIPNAILNKPGSFTEEEYEVMKSHVIHGYDELKKAIDGGAPIDEIVALVALEHHERFTGKGYPSQKKGRLEEDPENGIHLYSRIIAIADSYSALLMERVYKPALEANKALELLSQHSHVHFDPDIFGPFVNSVRSSLDSVEAAGCSRGKIFRSDDQSQSLVQQIRRKIG